MTKILIQIVSKLIATTSPLDKKKLNEQESRRKRNERKEKSERNNTEEEEEQRLETREIKKGRELVRNIQCSSLKKRLVEVERQVSRRSRV